jgi:hypothetical protein
MPGVVPIRCRAMRREDASHGLAAYTGLYSDSRGVLGRVRVRL